MFRSFYGKRHSLFHCRKEHLSDEEGHGSDEQQAEYLPDNSSSHSDDEPESETEEEITELDSSSE